MLVSSARFSRDDWEDLRQEMALDCLERTPWFNPDRGDWRGFVRGVVRNHSAVLATREAQRIRCETLNSADDDTDPTATGIARSFTWLSSRPLTIPPRLWY